MDKGKFKLGDEVWVVDYDNGEVLEGVCAYVFIGGNDNYAFLSPIVWAGHEMKTADELCDYYFKEYVEDKEYADVVIYPIERCFATREEAEQQRIFEVEE